MQVALDVINICRCSRKQRNENLIDNALTNLLQPVYRHTVNKEKLGGNMWQ